MFETVTYLQFVTGALVVFVSVFILVYPSHDKTSDEEHWSKQYNENDDSSNPISKIIIPPSGFKTKRKLGFTRSMWNRLARMYSNRSLRTGHSHGDGNNNERLIECFGLKGVFHLDGIPPESTPVFAFVNSKSGGKKGEEVMALLKCYLNPACQVIDLSKTRPESVITREFLSIPQLRFLVCGGDGTVSWVLNTVSEACGDGDGGVGVGVPPIAIYPLGTGNDLSHVLGWGSSVALAGGTIIGAVESTVSELLDSQCSDVPHLLMKIAACSTVMTAQVASGCAAAAAADGIGGRSSGSEKAAGSGTAMSAKVDVRIAELDRWRISVTPPIGADSSARLSAFSARQQRSLVFNNYFSVGVDAQIVHTFHQLRDQSPQHFVSQLGNKLWYGFVGGHQALAHDCRGLSQFVGLFVDDVQVSLPADLEGVIFSNIASYAGGTHLWQLEDEANMSGVETTEQLLSESGVLASTISTLETVGGEVLRYSYSASQLNLSDLSGDSGGSGSVGTSRSKSLLSPDTVPGEDADQTVGAVETRPDHFVPDAMNDGVIEVLGVTGSLHLAQIKSGLALPYKLAQIDCSGPTPVQIRLVTSRPMPMQMDGEPWIEEACDMTLTLIARKAKVVLCEQLEESEWRESLAETEAPTEDTAENFLHGMDGDSEGGSGSGDEWGHISLGSDMGADYGDFLNDSECYEDE